jgi:biotin transporter BioY
MHKFLQHTERRPWKELALGLLAGTGVAIVLGILFLALILGIG